MRLGWLRRMAYTFTTWWSGPQWEVVHVDPPPGREERRRRHDPHRPVYFPGARLPARRSKGATPLQRARLVRRARVQALRNP